MKRNWTKWIPLGNYNHISTDYIVFVKKNLKTGMMKFKVKKANKNLLQVNSSTFLPYDLINVRKAWEEITNL